jgi:hypothetical protein
MFSINHARNMGADILDSSIWRQISTSLFRFVKFPFGTTLNLPSVQTIKTLLKSGHFEPLPRSADNKYGHCVMKTTKELARWQGKACIINVSSIVISWIRVYCYIHRSKRIFRSKRILATNYRRLPIIVILCLY